MTQINQEKIRNARSQRGEGWGKLFDMLEKILKEIPNNVEISSIEKQNGMLSIKFVQSPSAGLNYITNAVAYKLERESAILCEMCGDRGKRRRNLGNSALCFICWVNESNK